MWSKNGYVRTIDSSYNIWKDTNFIESLFYSSSLCSHTIILSAVSFRAFTTLQK